VKLLPHTLFRSLMEENRIVLGLSLLVSTSPLADGDVFALFPRKI